MLDHTGGIDQVIPPVLITVAIGIAGGHQLGIGKKIVEIDLARGDLARIGIDRDKTFFAAAPKQGAGQTKGYTDLFQHVRILRSY